jgi:hypothetical protein
MNYRPLFFAVVLFAFSMMEAGAVPFRLGPGNTSNGSGNSGSANPQSSPSSPNFFEPLIYSQSFVSGKGSYEGGQLVGEALQGHDNPFLKNSGEVTELSWVESLIFGNLPGLPDSWTEPALSEANGRLINLSLGGEWDYGYFMAKWGAGENSADHALWYVSASDILNVQLPNDLSHARLWLHSASATDTGNPLQAEFSIAGAEHSIAVPDGGSTFFLLGGGLVLLFSALAWRSK